MRYLVDDKPDLNELAHFGIKGMKWGVTREDPTGGPSNRQKNKEFRAQRRQTRNNEIDAARNRIDNDSSAVLKRAKAQYEIDKQTMGSAAAKAKLNAVRDSVSKDFDVATQLKSGKETAQLILAVAGLGAIGFVLANRR